MNHDEIHGLLHAYADGELDLISTREIEKHLRGCDQCRGAYEQIRALRETLTSDAPAFSAPTHLRKNIRTALRREARGADEKLSPWLVLSTSTAFAAVVLGFVLFQATHVSRENAVTDQVIANHVRSLLASHLVDVASSDQHTVKPWFDGKIDFAPDVHDFSVDGFPLIGGRLDYLDGRTVVALVYQRNKHPINVFIMPASRSSDSSPVASTIRGYHILSFTHNDMRFWTISDLNETELRQFADLLTR
jgi:anti-sigma factor RsiW